MWAADYRLPRRLPVEGPAPFDIRDFLLQLAPTNQPRTAGQWSRFVAHMWGTSAEGVQVNGQDFGGAMD
jgi:hypothetical protein